jgi:hypothetical protein
VDYALLTLSFFWYLEKVASPLRPTEEPWSLLCWASILLPFAGWVAFWVWLQWFADRRGQPSGSPRPEGRGLATFTAFYVLVNALTVAVLLGAERYLRDGQDLLLSLFAIVCVLLILCLTAGIVIVVLPVSRRYRTAPLFWRAWCFSLAMLGIAGRFDLRYVAWVIAGV